MRRSIWFFLLLIPMAALADNLDLTEEELNPDGQEVLIKKPEKFLRDESMIYNLNSDLGIRDQRHYTGSDLNRLAIAGHVNSGYEHPNYILGAEASYMRRSTRYHQAWWGAQIFSHRAQFKAITRNSRAASSNKNAESNTRRPGDTRDSILAGGLGAGYRFKFFLDFLRTEDWFETVDVFVNYIRMDESFIDKQYQGYGLSTNYGIHKRTSTSYFYGFKLSYNIASVTRPAIGDEKKTDRSLSLGWMTAAFELGFFF
jgi:hypothetical protein